MLSSRLFWKLFLPNAALTIALSLGLAIGVSIWHKRMVMEQVEKRLLDTALILESHVAESSTADPSDASRGELQELVQSLSQSIGSRLTVIGADGAVWADSHEDPAVMENHANRPEVQQAAQSGFGKATRRSDTLRMRMFYVAVPIDGDGEPSARGFVRAAVAIDTIEARLSTVRWLMALFALAASLAALGLNYVMVGRIVRPLVALTRQAEEMGSGSEISGSEMEVHRVVAHDEVGVLAEAFYRMQEELSRRLEQLRDHTDRLATVLGSMDEGVLAVDANARILLANSASRVLLGFVTGDAVDRPLLEATRSLAVHQAVQQALATGKPCRVEFESPNENRRVLSLRASCLPGDPCPGAVVVLHDVSELRRLENLRRELVANVSHELKTPLSAIKAYAETLRLGAINDSEHNVGFLTRIEQESERLHQLIQEMLQVARIESGQEVFDIADVPVEPTVEACLNRHREAAGKKIELIARPPQQPVSVRADAEGFETILDNLIDNAVKYTPEGGRVTVSWRADHASVWIEVIDTGIGIAPDEQHRVFERFYRVDRARSRELGGTGLGLAIVKHLVQSFGGSIWLESHLGRGSTFRLGLPKA